MRRYATPKASRGTVIPSDVRMDVFLRDGYECVGKKLGWASHPAQPYPESALETDHVRASHGMGMKSETSPANLVSLCGTCHRWKTEHGKEARPLLLDYIARATTGCDHVDPVFGCASCQGRAYLAGVGA